MPDLSRSELAAYAACVVLVALLGWRVLRSDGAAAGSAGQGGAEATAAGSAGRGGATTTTSGSGSDAPSVSVAPARDGSATVHVVGAVQRAGVYRLRVGQRVQEAIRRAGGATSGADLQTINLAAKVADGQQVVVPRRAGAGSGGAVAGASAGGAAGGSGAGGAGPGASGAGGGPASAPVKLNSATAEQLDTLDGVGPATAQKILEYRTQHGGFSSIDDLAQISGIGPKKLEALRTQVTV